MVFDAQKVENKGRPIAVDLDGTLVKTDTLFELWLRLAKRDASVVFKSAWWLRKGLAYFKGRLVGQAQINVATLPYHLAVLDYLTTQRIADRKLWLVTARDSRIARQVAEHLQIFEGVMGTEEGVNLSGRNKATALVNKFGLRGFDYIGNSRKDLAVWEKAGTAHAVTNSDRLRRIVAKTTLVGKVWRSKRSALKAMWAAIRPHQWVKNLLLLIPMLADHQLNWIVGVKAGRAFVVFCLIASAIYLINDMLDLEADRRHPTKRYRPLASGELSLWQGTAMVIVLLGTGAIIAAGLDGLFVKMVITYFLLNLIYSLGAKQIVLLDVIILAVLYGLRIMAGGAAANIAVSDWLMALILFLALSGALMKRYVDLSRVKELAVKGNLSGRGYARADMALVGQMGIMSGFLAVLVMALYINSTQVARLYRHSEYWWLVALLLLYGVSRGWLNAYRGKIGDDPVMYIIRDPIYYWIIGLTIVLALLAI